MPLRAAHYGPLLDPCLKTQEKTRRHRHSKLHPCRAQGFEPPRVGYTVRARAPPPVQAFCLTHGLGAPARALQRRRPAPRAGEMALDHHPTSLNMSILCALQGGTRCRPPPGWPSLPGGGPRRGPDAWRPGRTHIRRTSKTYWTTPLGGSTCGADVIQNDPPLVRDQRAAST